MRGRSSVRQHVGHLAAGEHMVGDETAQRLAQAVTLVGNDGGMRNWHAQRMAEQRGHGEPVGDAADKTGLGGGLQQPAPPVRRHEIGDQRQGRHQHQQAGREHAVAAQGPPSEEVEDQVRSSRACLGAQRLFRPTRCNVIL